MGISVPPYFPHLRLTYLPGSDSKAAYEESIYHIRAEVFVLRSKGISQRRFLVDKNKQVERRPNRYTVFENTGAENQPLSENQ